MASLRGPGVSIPRSPSRSPWVSDLFYLFLGIGLFALMTLYVRAAAKA